MTHTVDFDPNSVARKDAGIFGLPFTVEDAWQIILPVPWEVTVSYGGGTSEGPKAILQASAQIVPADKLLIETDCPFLAPVPKRGKRNEPAFVSHVASYLAQLRGENLETLADFTTGNARELFKLPILSTI